MNDDDCPDHDELIRLKTIIDTDHEQLKERVTALEKSQWRTLAVTSLVSAGMGALVERLFKS